jgi:site-specific recombinase XerD
MSSAKSFASNTTPIAVEETYIDWIKRYILFHDKRHPREMGSREIEAFLSYLAIEGKVAASSQNQALSALLFLYREVLKQELDLPVDAIRAKRSRYLPTVLTKEEVLAVIQNLSGVYQIVIKLLYGSGLRLTEGLQLRVKDVDFSQQQLSIRDSKGRKTASGTFASSKAPAPTRFAERIWLSVSAICLRTKVPQC